MALQQTSGNVTADAYGGGVAAVPNYIEDVFSTWLYTGNGSAQTITNGIDLSTKGGLVWFKPRTLVLNHQLFDTARGANKTLRSNLTNSEQTYTDAFTSFNANGFTLGANAICNTSAESMVSWTFRKQPKFFDVVTYTGDLTSNRAIPHSLGSAPGMIIIKRTDGAASDWIVFHRSNPNDNFFLNDTYQANVGGYPIYFGANQPTASNFYVTNNGTTNGSGNSFVAYLFAHNAGGFGLTGTDNVVSCGSFTATGNDNVTLGYEPQWVMAKRSDGSGNWIIFDNMRGMPVSANTYTLVPNTSGAETNTAVQGLTPTATGFNNQWFGGSTNIIYIAIRRGPMKVPTDATKVFSPNAANAALGTALVTNFPVDLSISQYRVGDAALWSDRLRGVNSPSATTATPLLNSSGTAAETTTTITQGWDNTQIKIPTYYNAASTIWWNLRRAPGFFDEVCYTSTQANASINHNLGVAPELLIVKCRSNAFGWFIYSAPTGNASYLSLESTAAASGAAFWQSTTPTATQFFLNSANAVNGTVGQTYVAYLFATCAGVSKVGSYTGNGTTQTINCGFTAGARFVLIKATSTTGNWLTFDTARGMTVLTDPVLSLNSTAAETATLGACTTVSTGFALNESILTGVNTSSVSFVFLAIA